MSIRAKGVYGNYLEFTAPDVGYNKYGKVYNVWTEGTITNNLAFINSKSRCGLVVGFTSSDSEVEDCYYDYVFDGSRSQADTIKNPKGTCASNMSIDDLADVYGKAFSQSDFNSACNPENEMNGLKASTYTGYALMQIVYDNNGTEEILDMFPIFEVPGSGYDNIYLSKSLNDFYYSDTFIGENGNVYAPNNTQRIFLPTDGSVVKLYAKDKKEKIEPYYDSDPVMLPTTTESTWGLSSGENFVKWRTCLSKEPTTGPDTSGLIAVNRLYGTGTHNGDNATYSWYAEGTKPNGTFYEGDDIFLRFRIGSGVEANDGTIKTESYNIYKSWANATYRIGKTVLTEGNALNYFTFDAPTGQKYMTNHSLYEYPTVAARTDAIVTPPADFTLSYETESRAAVTGNPVAGEHYIIFEYAGNDIYAAENVEQKLTVNKRPVTVSVTNTEFTYGDDVKLNLKLGGNVYGETSNVDIEVTLEKPGKRITYNKDNISLPGTYNVDFLSGGTEKIPAGEYTVTVKVTHTDENSNYLNFNETLTGTTVTVNNAQPKQEFYYFRQYYTYDGLEKVPRVVKSETAAGAVTAIKIKPEGKTDYITSPIDAGKYGVYIDTAETDNYYAGEDLYIGDMEIKQTEPGESELNIVPPANLTYNGEPKAFDVTPKKDSAGGDLFEIQQLVYYDINRNDFIQAPKAPTEAGDYTLMVYTNESKNYKGHIIPIDFTIAKAQTGVDFNSIVYTGASGERLGKIYYYENDIMVSGKMKKAGENAKYPEDNFDNVSYKPEHTTDYIKTGRIADYAPATGEFTVRLTKDDYEKNCNHFRIPSL